MVTNCFFKAKQAQHELTTLVWGYQLKVKKKEKKKPSLLTSTSSVHYFPTVRKLFLKAIIVKANVSDSVLLFVGFEEVCTSATLANYIQKQCHICRIAQDSNYLFFFFFCNVIVK